ncbi:MAG: hypothetical protein WC821_03225 [archaeon]|jgi:hypothetical protein
MVEKKSASRILAKKEIIPQESVEIIHPKSSLSSKEAHRVSKSKYSPLLALAKNKLFLGLGVLVFLILLWFFVIFLPNSYRFSFQVDALQYQSNDYTPSEFFKLVRDNNSFVVSVELIDGNADPWVVNSMNLWLVGLNANKKHTISLIKTVDSFGNISSCITNDANVLSSRDLTSEECIAILNDSSNIRINLHKSIENKVVLYPKRAEIFAQKGEAFAIVSYSMIKNIFTDFDRTLAIINERINSVN